MLIKQRKGWEIAESQVTPEHMFLNRRAFMGTAASAVAFLSAGAARAEDDPSAGLYPAKLNATFADAGRPVTPLDINRAYNNYYEFGTSKQIYDAAEALPIRPWSIVIDGEVEAPMTLAIDDLLKKIQLEERIYRHRCVEAWSMAVPWSGFPLKKLVEMAKPLSSATYLRMETFLDKSIAPGQKQSWFPWPYIEGLTMAEATNELAFLATGAYGKPIAKQHGAPIRLAVPWKYGFKHIKSIVRVSFTDKRPKSYWQDLQDSEYGFWANVNPEVPHPRWSQATEELIGLGERRPTLLFNGYAEQVAGLYKGLEDKERLWA